MFKSIRQTWSRDAVGYRRGELDEAEAVATSVVALIGGPILVVGYLLVSVDALSVFQVLLVAPFAAVIGGVLVGGSALMGASTGANGTWLLHPSFGFGGSWILSLLRLAMIMAWGAIGLRLAGNWFSGSLTEAGVAAASPSLAVIALGVLGVVMTFTGLVPTVKNALRRPLFWGSVFMVAVLGWELATQGIGVSGGGSGTIWPGMQRAVEMSAVFVPLFQTVGRRMQREEVALSSYGVSYVVTVTLMLVLGALLATLGGDLGSHQFISQAGSLGLAATIAWVLVTEVDQVFMSLVAAGSEAAGIIPVVSPVAVGAVMAAGMVAASTVMEELPIELASLLTALVFPSVVIAAADFFVAKGRYYAEADTYGAHAGEARINLVGVGMWILAVVLGQVLSPVGPAWWVERLPATALSDVLPWRPLMAVVAGIGYVVLIRWRERRAARVFELRGV